ncbi:hypothetical protein [Streptomyces eurythermus]
MAPPPRRLPPPMGWNSRDCYGPTVTEQEAPADAEFMARRLPPYGWDTVVVDIQWYEPTARAHGYNPDAPLVLDAYGRQLPAPNRFPSTAGGSGFAPPARRVHELGLRFGPHIMRGIPRRAVAARLPVHGTAFTADEIADTASVCPWNTDNYGLDHGHPGAQACYDSQVARFAAWGVDFVEADDMMFPYRTGDRRLRAGRRALRPAGRAEPLPGHRRLPRPPGPPAGARHHVARLRRPVGPLGGRCPDGPGGRPGRARRAGRTPTRCPSAGSASAPNAARTGPVP